MITDHGKSGLAEQGDVKPPHSRLRHERPLHSDKSGLADDEVLWFGMVSFLVRWFVTAVAVLVTAQIVQGVHYDNYTALAVTALVLGILNAFLRPLLLLVTLPFNILSFGILTLFINALLFWMAGNVVKGFVVERFFWSAFLGALIVSIVSFILNSVLLQRGHIHFYRGTPRQPPQQRDDNVIDV